MSWLISKTLMNSLSLPEQVGESLVDTCLDGEQSAPLSGNPTQQAYCAPDKMTAFSRLSRFGMTYKPLTEIRGEELLTLFLGGFHAKTSQPLGVGQESMENAAECGKKWHGSFVRYDLDSSLWKTHQCSLLGDLESFLETWPRWGLMRSGECWEQPMLAHHNSATESGSEQKQMWLTPRVVEVDETPENFRRRMNSKRPNDRKDGFGSLTMQVKAMQKWPTPRTKGMCGGSGAWDLLNKNTTLEEARQMGAGNGGKLNPTWVEWLMGWPLGWTDLKPLAMDKSHSV
jgi:hypothetical protein